MSSNGIRDRVAIVGMGCTNFGEHWDMSVDDMLIESSEAAMMSAGVTRADIDAYWFGTMGSGVSGLTLSRALRLEHKPVTRVETTAACTLETVDGAPKITRIALTTRGKVPGLDQAGFQKAAEDAKNNCPVSKALKGNVDFTLDAKLE